MNRFENKLCPVCRARFTDKADVVVCPICGTPHHRVCYEIKGECSLNELHESGFVWNGYLPDEPVPSDANEGVNAEITDFSESKTDENVSDEPTFSMFGDDDASFGGFFKMLRDPALGEDGVSMRELTSYSATSPFHYGKAFEAFRTKIGGKKRRVYFNFASGFLAPAFQFYRKMDVFGLIVTVIMLIPTSIATFYPAFYQTSAAYYLLNLFNIALLIVLSAYGDYFYYRHAVKSIIKFRGNYKGDTQSEEYFAALAEKGRPSFLRAFIGFLILMFLMGGIMWLSGNVYSPIGLF